ncbi:hypothetical protein I8540_002848, partial [Clostridium perfringens]|nr:hypothetical protein [Clostridium perfringens]
QNNIKIITKKKEKINLYINTYNKLYSSFIKIREDIHFAINIIDNYRIKENNESNNDLIENLKIFNIKIVKSIWNINFIKLTIQETSNNLYNLDNLESFILTLNNYIKSDNLKKEDIVSNIKILEMFDDQIKDYNNSILIEVSKLNECNIRF